MQKCAENNVKAASCYIFLPQKLQINYDNQRVCQLGSRKFGLTGYSFTINKLTMMYV